MATGAFYDYWCLGVWPRSSGNRLSIVGDKPANGLISIAGNSYPPQPVVSLSHINQNQN